jgi:hypothetical protein
VFNEADLTKKFGDAARWDKETRLVVKVVNERTVGKFTDDANPVTRKSVEIGADLSGNLKGHDCSVNSVILEFSQGKSMFSHNANLLYDCFHN